MGFWIKKISKIKHEFVIVEDGSSDGTRVDNWTRKTFL